MSNVTAIITEMIRSYPMLYPDRVSALIAIFSTSTFSIDRKTGDLIDGDPDARMRNGTYEAKPFGDGLLPAKPDDSDDMREFRRKMNEEDKVRHDLEQLRLVFISNNADIIARSSVHDTIKYLSEIVIPYFTDTFIGDRPSFKDLSDDVRDALIEMLIHYEHILCSAQTIIGGDQKHLIIHKTWDLTMPMLSSYLHRAMELREEMTGKTLEQRRAENRTYVKKLMSNLGAAA